MTRYAVGGIGGASQLYLPAHPALWGTLCLHITDLGKSL